ncbi:hypothetical protein K525DRAFT_270761 [Schizophyllum commune Loenen D]|nr:hypothetical protein K525DRAFT_270761 [Schizophyllum commune Loenen D]
MSAQKNHSPTTVRPQYGHSPSAMRVSPPTLTPACASRTSLCPSSLLSLSSIKTSPYNRSAWRFHPNPPHPSQALTTAPGYGQDVSVGLREVVTGYRPTARLYQCTLHAHPDQPPRPLAQWPHFTLNDFGYINCGLSTDLQVPAQS